MALRALFFSALLLSGCGGLPDPRIVSITPSEVVASSITPIAVTLEAVLPTEVNYFTGEATADNGVSVFIGFTEAGSSRIESDGTVRALVPANLERGTHDVSVRLKDGRRSVSPASLTIR